MANTKKVKTEELAAEVDVSAEMKAKIAAQEKQIEQLMAMVQAQLGSSTKITKPNKSIKFISLVTGGLTLKGNRMYHIDKQFGYKMIPEGEAKAIVANMPNTIVNGMVYIADKDFVEACELSGVYEEILSDKQLKELLQRNANDVCEIYKQASQAQKEIIVDMVVNRKLNGMPIDANIVVEIGKLCGKDLMSITPEEEE